MPKWNEFLEYFSSFFKERLIVVLSMFRAKCYACNGGKENEECKICNGTGVLLYLQETEIKSSKKSDSNKEQT